MQLPARLDIGERLVPALGAAAAIYLIAVPVIMLLYAAFRGPPDYLPFETGAQWTLENLIGVFNDPVLYSRILPDTLFFVLGTVVLTTFLAFTFAWLVERTDIRGSDVWFSLILFPLLVPIPVLAIAWIFLLGPNAGWINVAIRSIFGLDGPGPLNVFSMTGLIVCQSMATTPFVFLLLSSVLRSMNPQMEEASGASGASPFTTFRHVTLPVLLPGILAPVILLTLITLEQFELPLIIGLPARINVFAYRIFNELNPASGLPNYGGAAAFSIPFLLLGMIALVFYNWAIRRGDKFAVVTGKAYRQRQIALGRWRYAAHGLMGLYAALAVALPALTLAWTSVLGYSAPSFANLGKATLDAYQEMMANAKLLARGWQHAPGRLLHRAGFDHGRSAARLDHHPVTMVGPARPGLPLLHVHRHPLGDRRAGSDDPLSVGADRNLRHGLDPGPRLRLPHCRNHPNRPRRPSANPRRVGGGIRGVGGKMARDPAAHRHSSAAAGSDVGLHPDLHCQHA
jgi:iron(III) transport system permease protein